MYVGRNGAKNTQLNPYSADDGAKSIAWNICNPKSLNGQFYTYGQPLSFEE